MNTDSKSSRTFSAAPSGRATMFGSSSARAGAPARSSSQFAPQVGFISLPVSAERVETEGLFVPAAAVIKRA